MEGWQQYMQDVLNSKRIAGRLEYLCVERSVRLAQNNAYFFDVAEVERVHQIVRLLRHTKGKYKGVNFDLMPWQSYFIAMLFGMKIKETNKRLFRKALLCVSKKNGKSEFAAAIAILMTIFDGEGGAECYSAANKYDQAKISWDAAGVMIKQLQKESESIEQDIKVYDSINNRLIKDLPTGSFFKPIASDSKTLDGINVHFGLIDEFHEAKDDSIPNNMESAMVAREQPLLLIITTRGFNIRGPLWQLERNYIQILEGEQENDRVFPLIFALDEEDDWQDSSLWEKSNPGLGRTPTLENLQVEYDKAITEGASREINFKTKNLNVWTSVSATWVKNSDIMKGCTDWSDEEMEGLLCFCGLDLAKTRDITCVAYLFPPQAHFDRFRVMMRYYVPDENAVERSRRDQVPYVDWGQRGNITLTQGNVADYDFMYEEMLNFAKSHRLHSVAYDPWNAAAFATKLNEQDIQVREFRQNTTTFNEPITYMEGIILKGELDHRNDPVLSWMFANIQPYFDGNGNIKFDKAKSREKIDGAVALAMAFDEYLKYKLTESPDFNIIWN